MHKLDSIIRKVNPYSHEFKNMSEKGLEISWEALPKYIEHIQQLGS